MESGGSWRDFAEPLGFQVGVCGCLLNFCEKEPHHLRVVLRPNFMSRLLLGFATACVTSSTKIHIQDLQTAACRDLQCCDLPCLPAGPKPRKIKSHSKVGQK